MNYDAYPATGATAPNNGANYSTQAGWMSVLVSEKLFSSPPKDPINIDIGPWCWGGNSAKNTIYTYASDGRHYILCGWMENTSDRETLQFKDLPNPWNVSEKLYANYSYSGYNYVIAK